jgi:hypothetical protein
MAQATPARNISIGVNVLHLLAIFFHADFDCDCNTPNYESQNSRSILFLLPFSKPPKTKNPDKVGSSLSGL